MYRIDHMPNIPIYFVMLNLEAKSEVRPLLNWFICGANCFSTEEIKEFLTEVEALSSSGMDGFIA